MEEKIEKIKLKDVMAKLKEKIQKGKMEKPLKLIKLSSRPEIKKA